MGYSRILVAIDRSTQSDIVFEQALDLAKKEQANLMVFHCLPVRSESAGSYSDVFGRDLVNFKRTIQEYLDREIKLIHDWLSEYSQKGKSQGIATEWDCKIGDAGSCIRDLANAWNADLVVMGRRGYRGLAEAVLGSVSNYVIHHVGCSVLIVQGIGSDDD